MTLVEVKFDNNRVPSVVDTFCNLFVVKGTNVYAIPNDVLARIYAPAAKGVLVDP